MTFRFIFGVFTFYQHVEQLLLLIKQSAAPVLSQFFYQKCPDLFLSFDFHRSPTFVISLYQQHHTYAQIPIQIAVKYAQIPVK